MQEQEQQEKPNTLKLGIHVGSEVLYSPFFMTDTSDNKYVELYPEEEQIKTSVLDNVLKKEYLGRSLRSVYRAIRDPDHGFFFFDENGDKEENGFEFLSPKEIAERQDVYNGKMIDIARMCRGMGHVIMLAYIPKTDNFFVRTDGGSNDYDRELNFKRYSSSEFRPDELRLYVTKQDKEEDCQFSYKDIMTFVSNHKWIF